jgi:hypothetical protein
LKFLPQPYTRLGKLPLIKYNLLCIEFSQILLIPYERFVMLLKSRSRTYHLYMHYSYTGSKRKNMLFRLLKKCYTSILGVNIKNIPYRKPLINAPSSYCYLSQVLLQKRSMWLYKSYLKKEKNRQVSKNKKEEQKLPA